MLAISRLAPTNFATERLTVVFIVLQRYLQIRRNSTADSPRFECASFARSNKTMLRPRMKTVLFIHGLESGPNGHKPKALAEAGFRVVSDQMPCGRRHVIRDPAVIAGFAVGVIGLAISTIRGGLRGLAKASLLGSAILPIAYTLTVRRAFSRSLEVQRNALANNTIDLVVGSSFGGAVALELLHSRLWTGPTILLCPAHQLVASRSKSPAPLGLSALGDVSNVLVVHGRSDQTVPIEHSRALVSGSNARLIEVEDNHQLTATATAEGLAEWISFVCP